MLEIFDSHTHPTLTNTWLNERFDGLCDVNYLVADMRENAISKACAVGMEGVGGYKHDLYIEMLKPYPQLVPVAYYDPPSGPGQLEYIKKLGFQGIKIHPRLSAISPTDRSIFDAIKEANSLGLAVFYCGFTGVTETFLKYIGDEKLVFLHSGGHSFLPTINLLKDKKNLLLDLSYTLCRMPDQIYHIEKILHSNPDIFCIGSDHPEVSLSELRKVFDEIAACLPYEDAARIAYQNLENFFLSMGKTK